jgi:hypothetical protein
VRFRLERFPLERFPIARNHMLKKKLPQFDELEHIRMEKAEQLF